MVVDLFWSPWSPPAEFAPTRQLHPDFDVREGGHRQALFLTKGHHLHGLGRPAERPQRLGCFTALLVPGSPQKMLGKMGKINVLDVFVTDDFLIVG